nr:hypothetical protein [uncultured Pedobacter sp.]
MAAEATVYLNNGAKLPVKLDGVAQYDALVALKLSAYGSNIKTLFYLDAVLVADNGAGSSGFVGMVKIGGANYIRHASARRSKTVLQNASADQFILLNDAGLNTLGDATNASVPVPLVGVVSGSDVLIKVLADFLSAYYVDTTDYGVEYLYKTTGSIGGSYIAVSAGTLAQATASTAKDFYLSGFDRANITPDNKLYVRPYLTNPEGKFIGTEISVSIMAAYQVVKSDYSYEGVLAACSHPGSGTTMTVYSERGDFNIGDTLYLDAQKTTTAPAASYGFEIYSSEPKFVGVNSSGVITDFGYCPDELVFDVFADIDDSIPGSSLLNVTVTEHTGKNTITNVEVFVQVTLNDVDPETGDPIVSYPTFTLTVNFTNYGTYKSGTTSVGVYDSIAASADITSVSITPTYYTDSTGYTQKYLESH